MKFSLLITLFMIFMFASCSGVNPINKSGPRTDLYGEKFHGDGAPVWATIDDDLPYTYRTPWWINYAAPAVERAFDHFWINTDGIQDRFIQMWCHVAKRFGHRHYRSAWCVATIA